MRVPNFGNFGDPPVASLYARNKSGFWRAFACSLALFCSVGQVNALDMTPVPDRDEKLLYLNMSGKIMPTDDERFRSIVLPYIRSGYALYKVSIFTPGGDVYAAVGIGKQIHMLQATTDGPVRLAKYVGGQRVLTNNVECLSWSKVGHNAPTNNGPYDRFKRNIETNEGSYWCDCASSCFFIWASGLARTGNWIGIHRFRFDEVFRRMLPRQARDFYIEYETEYRAYMRELHVPQSIIDTLFATPSTSIHYLTDAELSLGESTPYLEETALARCGPSKTNESGASDENANTDIDCYQGILKDLAREGARNYLKANE